MAGPQQNNFYPNIIGMNVDQYYRELSGLDIASLSSEVSPNALHWRAGEVTQTHRPLPLMSPYAADGSMNVDVLSARSTTAHNLDSQADNALSLSAPDLALLSEELSKFSEFSSDALKWLASDEATQTHRPLPLMSPYAADASMNVDVLSARSTTAHNLDSQADNALSLSAPDLALLPELPEYSGCNPDAQNQLASEATPTHRPLPLMSPYAADGSMNVDVLSAISTTAHDLDSQANNALSLSAPDLASLSEELSKFSEFSSDALKWRAGEVTQTHRPLPLMSPYAADASMNVDVLSARSTTAHNLDSQADNALSLSAPDLALLPELAEYSGCNPNALHWRAGEVTQTHRPLPLMSPYAADASMNVDVLSAISTTAHDLDSQANNELSLSAPDLALLSEELSKFSEFSSDALKWLASDEATQTHRPLPLMSPYAADASMNVDVLSARSTTAHNLDSQADNALSLSAPDLALLPELPEYSGCNPDAQNQLASEATPIQGIGGSLSEVSPSEQASLTGANLYKNTESPQANAIDSNDSDADTSPEAEQGASSTSGPKNKITQKSLGQALTWLKTGEPQSKICEKLGLSLNTLRTYITSKGQLTKRGEYYLKPRLEYDDLTPTLLKKVQTRLQAGQKLREVCVDLNLYFNRMRNHIKSNGELSTQGQAYLKARPKA